MNGAVQVPRHGIRVVVIAPGKNELLRVLVELRVRRPLVAVAGNEPVSGEGSLQADDQIDVFFFVLPDDVLRRYPEGAPGHDAGAEAVAHHDKWQLGWQVVVSRNQYLPQDFADVYHPDFVGVVGLRAITEKRN